MCTCFSRGRVPHWQPLGNLQGLDDKAGNNSTACPRTMTLHMWPLLCTIEVINILSAQSWELNLPLLGKQAGI